MVDNSHDRTTIHPKTVDEDDRRALMNSLITKKCLQEMRLTDVKQILDVGCRDGEFTRAVARAVGSSARVVGSDRDEDSIDKANRKAKEAGEVDLVEFRHGDPTDLQLGDGELGSFDVVFARFVLEHERHPLAVVKQMKEAARPGGRIILADDDHDLLRLWPEPPGVMSAWNAYVRLYQRRGTDPYVGRRLVQLLLEAGAQHVHNAFPFVGSCAGHKELRDMVDNIQEPLLGTRDDVVYLGLIDAQQFDAAITSLLEWRGSTDAALWWGISWAEGSRP